MRTTRATRYSGYRFLTSRLTQASCLEWGEMFARKHSTSSDYFLKQCEDGRDVYIWSKANRSVSPVLFVRLDGVVST